MYFLVHIRILNVMYSMILCKNVCETLLQVCECYENVHLYIALWHSLLCGMWTVSWVSWPVHYIAHKAAYDTWVSWFIILLTKLLMIFLKRRLHTMMFVWTVHQLSWIVHDGSWIWWKFILQCAICYINLDLEPTFVIRIPYIKMDWAISCCLVLTTQATYLQRTIFTRVLFA